MTTSRHAFIIGGEKNITSWLYFSSGIGNIWFSCNKEGVCILRFWTLLSFSRARPSKLSGNPFPMICIGVKLEENFWKTILKQPDKHPTRNRQLTSSCAFRTNAIIHVPSAQCNTCDLVTNAIHVPLAPMPYLCSQHHCSSCALSTTTLHVPLAPMQSFTFIWYCPSILHLSALNLKLNN